MVHVCMCVCVQDVASGYLLDEGRSYHLVICSYAMHVLDTSYLYATLQQLALVCEALLIISPHKLPQVRNATEMHQQQANSLHCKSSQRRMWPPRHIPCVCVCVVQLCPQVDEETGWSLQQHDTVDRVHTRLYKSTILLAESDLQLLT